MGVAKQGGDIDGAGVGVFGALGTVRGEDGAGVETFGALGVGNIGCNGDAEIGEIAAGSDGGMDSVAGVFRLTTLVICKFIGDGGGGGRGGSTYGTLVIGLMINVFASIEPLLITGLGARNWGRARLPMSRCSCWGC